MSHWGILEVIRNDGSLENEYSTVYGKRLNKANQAMGMLSKVWVSTRLILQSKMYLPYTLQNECGIESWYDSETISSF